MFFVLPKELHGEILQFLDPDSTLAMWKTNKYWKALIDVHNILIPSLIESRKMNQHNLVF